MKAAAARTIEWAIDDQPLFASAEAAVRFALSIDGRPPRPATSRMLDRMMPRTEFTALDRAAQAGMIENIIERQGRLAVAIMTAAVAPRWKPCSCRRPCCSGREKNFSWYRAVYLVAESSLSQLPDRAKIMLVVACISKLYGGMAITQRKIAEELCVDEDTVGKYLKALQRWLRGGRGARGQPPQPGIEQATWREAENALRSAGIVG